MPELRPITYSDTVYLDRLQYAGMNDNEKKLMISESLNRSSNGRFFELLLVFDSDTFVGVMNLYESAPGVISIGPEIVPELRRRGYASDAMTLAYDYAHSLGFTKASAQVRKNNTASIALHRKLGFEITAESVSRHGNEVYIFEKSLL